MSRPTPGRIVIKCGGAVAAEAAGAIRRLAAGRQACIVHGAGPQISAEMQRVGLPVEFVGGRRVTSPEALEIVRASFVAVNRALCAALGPRAVGLFGDEIGLRANPVPELGQVGDPIPTRPTAIEAVLGARMIPVVTPLAAGPLNVNADEMAAALAVGLGADSLFFLTDVPGLLHDGAVVSEIEADEAEALLAGGTLEGGILPKLSAAIHAARLGVRAEIGETAVVA
jgi:acetylglutamate kinase